MATKAAILKHAQHLMDLNKIKHTHQYTMEDALDVAKYDLEYCNNDEDSKDYLINETMADLVTEEEAEDLYFKKKKMKHSDLLTPAQKKENATKAAKAKEHRMGFLVNAIEKAPELFGTDFEVTNVDIKGIAPDTGLGYTIKLAKHKEQKVFNKFTPRKANAGDLSMNEVRVAAIAYIVATENEDLFEAPSFAGSAIGFVNRDEKFGYGSIKVTHHKAKKA